MFPEYMSNTEQKIVGLIIRKALQKPYLVSVWDGESYALKDSNDYEAITSEVHATDITVLEFEDPDNSRRVGSVVLVHGNDEDVVHDHTDNPQVADLCS